MDFILAILMAVGLSAACGFRVFVPMFVLSIAANGNHLQLGESFQWIGSDLAMVVFGLATALEIGAYYLPWLDNMLDSVATPAAVVAGSIAAASCVTGESELIGWVGAAIAGGSIAGGVQLTTVATRMTSLATTGGAGNPVVSTIEATASTVVSVLAIVLPLIIILFVLGFGYLVYRIVNRRRARKQASLATQPPTLPADPPAAI
ncbi:MAG: hypothetical protein CMJ19_13195 [Phycisphaeraceae bacterium]|nr:hypothetical protein [Phycisphaeraceae bacterium]